MKDLKERISNYVVNLLLEVTGKDLDEIAGGYICIGYGASPAR